ncbi:MAG: hypothetical protein ABL883_01950 [Terricaulis sp.]
MSNDFLELDDLPPSMQRRMIEAAEISGLDLSDFVSNLLSGARDAGPTRKNAFARQGSENFAYRHRVEALERRLGASTASLETALRSLEAATLSIEARVCDAEGVALGAQAAIREDTQTLSEEIALLQKRLAGVERDGFARWQGAENVQIDYSARLSRADQHLDFVEDVARGARQTAALLAEAHHALKHAVAEDFATLALDTAANIDGGLQAIREDSEAAGARADAALQALLRDFRDFVAATETGIANSAAETRDRMREAFGETESQLGALADRLSNGERAATLASESLAAQLAALAEANHSKLEGAVADLSRADSALEAALLRSNAERRNALESLGNRFDANLETHEQHAAGRLDRIESMQAATSSALSDNIARVEACTLAALEKLAADIAGADGKFTLKLGEAATRSAQAVEQLEAELASLHGQHCGVAARLHLIDRTLGMAILAHEADPPVAERLAELEQTQAEQQLHLEKALDKSSTNRELKSLRGEVAGLAKRMGDLTNEDSLAQALEDLRQRLDAHTAQNTEFVRSLNRASAKSAGAAAYAEDRFRKFEQAAKTGEVDRVSAKVAVVENRISEIVSSQGEALARIQTDIARFVEQQERRLAAVEANDHGARLDAIAASIDRGSALTPAPDFVAEFDSLRQRLEARIHDMDGRNIRTLEQVSETIALLEQQLNARSQQRLVSSA